MIQVDGQDQLSLELLGVRNTTYDNFVAGNMRAQIVATNAATTTSTSGVDWGRKGGSWGKEGEFWKK
ncbi:multiple cyclophane-containing RiPP AmcA [Lentzea sp. JNUCC 0626]|uniref:multiple cyclophane-containing RiPP AmcA n=1 Tax=Lentzea sp. JNUCC 0626 TaxID=3367513 RepID=UPI0037489901